MPEHDFGKAAQGSEQIDHPVGQRVPDHPVQRMGQAAFVAAVDEDADAELQQAGHGQHHTREGGRHQRFNVDLIGRFHEKADRP